LGKGVHHEFIPQFTIFSLKSLKQEQIHPDKFHSIENFFLYKFIQTPLFYNTVGSPILSTTPYRSVPYRSVPYRTVPYRFPLQFLSRSRSLSARRTVVSA
jgi:hypothetical protein